MSDAPKKEVFFFEDEPLAELTPDCDAFGHVHYATTLVEILERHSSASSYVVGLFGSWGVGKTSIINQAAAILKQPGLRRKYRVAVLDAWRFSRQSFRRDFLLALGDQLHERGYVEDKLSEKSSVTERELPDAKAVLRLWPWLVALLAFWAIGTVLGTFVTNGTAAALGSALLGIVALLVALLHGALEPRVVTFETLPPVHADQFRDVFSGLVDKIGLSGQDRLVIVLDNLDRLPAEIVLEVLSATKSFLNLKGCVYVLPCDEVAVRLHLARNFTDPTDGERHAQDYVRKFFQVSLTLRGLLNQDLAAYVRSVVDQMAVFELWDASLGPQPSLEQRKRSRDYVSIVMAVAVRSDPRSVIQMANRLTTMALLAWSRGREQPELAREVLGNLGFLAKLSVIEERWPTFYKQIAASTVLAHEVSRFAIENQDLPPIVSDLDKNTERAVVGFLNQTSVVPDRPAGEYTSLKHARTQLAISDYGAFREKLTVGDVGKLREHWRGSGTDFSAAVSEIRQTLDRQTFEERNLPAALTTLKAAVAALQEKEAPPTAKPLADAGLSVLRTAGIATAVQAVGLAATLVLVRAATRGASRDAVMQELIPFAFGDDELRPILLSGIAEDPPILSDVAAGVLCRVIGGADENEVVDTDIRRFATELNSRPDAGTLELIPTKYYERQLRAALLGHQESSGVVKGALPNLPQSQANFVWQADTDLIGVEGASLTPGTVLFLDVLAAWPQQNQAGAAADAVLKALAQAAATTQDPRVIDTFRHLLGCISDNAKKAFLGPLRHYITSRAPDDLADLCSQLVEHGGTLLEEGIPLDIQHVAIASPAHAKLRQAMFELLAVGDGDGSDAISDFCREAWEDHDVFDAGLLKDAKAKLPQKLWRALLWRLTATTIESGGQSEALLVLKKFLLEPNSGMKQKTAEHLANRWLVSEDDGQRSAAFSLWSEIAEELGDTSTIVTNTILATAEEGGSIPGGARQREALDALVAQRTLLTESRQKRLVSVVLRLITEGLPIEVVSYGHGLLRQMEDLADAVKAVPGELIEDLEAGPEDDRFAEIVQTLGAYSTRLSKQQRKRVAGVFKETDRPDTPDWLT